MSDDTRRCEIEKIIAITKNNLHTNGAGGVTSAEYTVPDPGHPEREAEIKKDGIHLGDMAQHRSADVSPRSRSRMFSGFAIDKGYLTEGKAVGFTPGKGAAAGAGGGQTTASSESQNAPARGRGKRGDLNAEVSLAAVTRRSRPPTQQGLCLGGMFRCTTRQEFDRVRTGTGHGEWHLDEMGLLFPPKVEPLPSRPLDGSRRQSADDPVGGCLPVLVAVA